ncbi:MAG: ABC transporter permease, partial [Butyricimonas paravirosa]
LSRNRVYTVINIVGLSIAFSAAWLIYSHTSNEWNMDGYLKNSDNIYRVITRYGDEDFWNCRTNTPFGPAAKRTFPEIVQVARYFQKDYRIKIEDSQDFTIEPKLAFVDPPFFDLFEIPVIQGKIDTTVFSWIVFTETSAKRYFNKENPIGKTVTIKDGINNRKKDIKCQVVAVIKDFPASTIQPNHRDCRQGIHILMNVKKLLFFHLFSYPTTRPELSKRIKH